MTETRAQLESLLDDFDPAERRKAFETLLEDVWKGAIALPERGTTFNLHCHTFFSFNGYGYSPTGLVWRGLVKGLSAMGLVDFDVLDGVEEFLGACRLAGLPCGAGMESRVFVPEFADREINSPGEPGVSYHMGMGFVPGPYRDTGVADELAELAQSRNRRMVERVNTLLEEIALDYEKDVLPLTPKGNATERHVCAAYYGKAEKVFPERDIRAAYWAAKLGMDREAVDRGLDDAPTFQGNIRAKTMKKGGVGYVEAKGEEFPTADRMNRFSIANGAIPTFAFLDGASSGERCMDELLDVMQAGGVAAVNIIPDRNWNIKDPEIKKTKVAHFHDFVDRAKSRHLPIFIGTEMNAHGQRFVDDFSAPEMDVFKEEFRAGAWLLHGHTVLQAAAGMGYVSDWAKSAFVSTGLRNAFYEKAGQASAAITRIPEGIGPQMEPEEIIKALTA